MESMAVMGKFRRLWDFFFDCFASIDLRYKRADRGT